MNAPTSPDAQNYDSSPSQVDAERKRMEEALSKSEERFRQLAEIFPETIFEADLSGHLTYANLNGYKWYGITDEDIKHGLNIMSLVIPSERETVKQRLAERVQGKTGGFLEYTALPRVGKPFDALAYSAPIFTDGTITGIRGFILDISKRKRAEKELAHAHWRMESIIDGAHVGTMEWNVQLGVALANEVWAEIIGYTPTELANMADAWDHRPWEAFAHPEDATKIVEQLERHFSGEIQFHEYECRVRHKKGHWVWVHDRGRVITRTPEGKPLMMFGTRTDITARKHAEAEREKLEIQNRQLHKTESLSRMAGAIAHHFNNDLQGVMMNLEVAMNDLPQDIPVLETLNAAMKSAREAAQVSSLMLTYLGQTYAKLEALDLSQVCLQNLPILRASLPQHLLLEAELPSSGPIIRGNASQLKDVLSHLVSNACEASTDSPSVLRLSVKTVAASEIPTTNRFPIEFHPQDAKYVYLEIKDSGCGIPEKNIEKIFDPFYSTKFTGRGLGLPVVLGIVRAFDGVVTVESQPGRGSSFRVYLRVVN